MTLNSKKINMKTIGISKVLVACLLILFCSFTIRNAKIEMTTLKFEKTVHDFGKLTWHHGVHETVIFKFSNTGKKPLLIKNVKTSCGCTVPKWPKEMIKPKETREIKIIYDGSHLGGFNKSIDVFYNGENSPQKLIIKGEIIFPGVKN